MRNAEDCTQPHNNGTALLVYQRQIVEMRRTPEERPYETIAAWQKAIAFMQGCYTLARRFPADERFALTLPLKRASLAVSANLAEGYGRWSKKELIYKIAVARGELFEAQSERQAAVAVGYITPSEAQLVLEIGDEVSRLLTQMRATPFAR